MAERLLAHALRQDPELSSKFSVSSAGLLAMEGEGPSIYAVEVLKQLGIDLEDHQSTYLTQELLDKARFVFCMTRTHLSQLRLAFGHLPAHVMRLRDVLPPGQQGDISDPFGMDLADYVACRDNIIEALPHVLRFLKSHQT
jgi:protein-tyrosine phosphatase